VDLVDVLAAEWQQREIVAHYERVARQLRRRNWLRRFIDSDAFFILCGGIVAADLCLVVGLFTGAF